MNAIQIALAFARGEQPILNAEQHELLKQPFKLFSVFLTEDDGDGETESMPFQYVYATRELAKKGIEDHIKEAYDDEYTHSVEWIGEPGQEICSINWPETSGWAELRIDEVTLVTE